MSEQANESRNIFKYKPTTKGCCDIFMESTDTEKVIEFPSEIDGMRVTGIGYGACEDCKNVETVIVPEGVLRIRSFAFSHCPKLQRIHLPSTLEHVSTMDLFYRNEVALVTCDKGKPHDWWLNEDFLPAKKVAITNTAATRAEADTDTVNILTVYPYDADFEIVYQKYFYLRWQSYATEKAEAALAAAKESYELILETVCTYDVYSSDGVDPNDRDESTEVLDFSLENLVFSEEGTCCGIFCKDANFDGILFFDGKTMGTVSCGERKLCYGHPLDYYIHTGKTLILRKK